MTLKLGYKSEKERSEEQRRASQEKNKWRAPLEKVGREGGGREGERN
jgi:hypothetical protein